MLLGNQAITVVTRTPSTKDAYGVASESESQTAVTGCSVQPGRSSEKVTDTDLVQTHWTLFAPPGTQLGEADAVIYNGAKYEVDGDPMVWSDHLGQPHHLHAHLRRVTG